MTGESEKQAQTGVPGAGKRDNIPAFFTAAIVIAIALTLCVGAYMVTSAGDKASVPGGNDTPRPDSPLLYLKSVDACYENLTQISVIENHNAVDPCYGQLISFLEDDATEQGVYGTGHECSSFAVELHDNAEQCYIKAHLVLVSLSNAPLHMIVGFNTTDRGMLYVDDTGLTAEDISRNILVADRTVNLTVGSAYIRHFLPPFNFDEDPGMGVVESFSVIS